jgi:hypothetical protein
MTPVKALKSGAALMMRTLADDVAWVAKCQATMERLKVKEVAAKAGASAQEVTRVGDAAWEPELVEAALGGTRLDGSSIGGPEPGSTARTLETVEVGKAETSVRDARQADVEKIKEVVEALPDAGKEEEPRPQPQQDERSLEPQLDQPEGQVVEPEREVVMLLLNV